MGFHEGNLIKKTRGLYSGSLYESYYLGVIGPGFFNQVPTLKGLLGYEVPYFNTFFGQLLLKGNQYEVEVFSFCSLATSKPKGYGV